MVMLFSLCNVPSTLQAQAMMNKVLCKEIATSHVVVYINILIFTDDLDF